MTIASSLARDRGCRASFSRRVCLRAANTGSMYQSIVFIWENNFWMAGPGAVLNQS